MVCTSSLLAAFACLIPQGNSSSGNSVAGIVINEFHYDQGSVDRSEFIELYNTSNSAVDIGGWRIDITEAGQPVRSIQLVATGPLRIGERFLVGASTVRGVNLVINGEFLPDDTTALTLRDRSGAIVDTVVYEAFRGGFDPALAEGSGIFPDLVSPAAPELYSWQRFPDGVDNDDNQADFRFFTSTPDGPGVRPTPLPFVTDFSLRPIGSQVPEFLGADVGLRVIDPTAFGPSISGGQINPLPISPSPTGGRAGIVWDPGGGGEMAILGSPDEQDGSFSGCVYFEAAALSAGEWECWVLGMRGYGGSSCVPPDPSGRFWAMTGRSWQPDYTGVAAVYQRSALGNELFLVDFSGGGAGRSLGSMRIPFRGWFEFEMFVNGQEARLAVSRPGLGNVGTIEGRVSTISSGSIYVGHRGELVNRSRARPFTYDDGAFLRPRPPSVRTYGISARNSLTGVRFDYLGEPRTGTTGELMMIGNLPGPLLLAFGARPESPTLLGPQFPPGTALYVNAFELIPLHAPSALVRMPLSIPDDPWLVGRSFAFQVLQFDPALPYPLPLSHSAGLELVVGR